ncbi:probable RNA-dependent RNA polymerase 1 [Aristolochia californica]|uniref:probable RNA-dependent RNA polymerase 1 n=1 Tax=Aristolochia californica TaxID=171875 RepID=UPI0035DBB15D
MDFRGLFADGTWSELQNNLNLPFAEARPTKKLSARTIQVSDLPATASTEEVKNFLESHTGEGTVYAVKVRQPKRPGPNARPFAIVQFKESKDANKIAREAQQNLLRFGCSGLKVRYVERDIVPKPKTFLSTLEGVTLHLGCQVSADEFSVLWNVTNVKVKFEFGLKKLEFVLSYAGHEYRLDLFYGSIWQIQLRCPRGQNRKFILIQVQAAPRIYKRNLPISGNAYEDSFKDFFFDIPDENWVRTIDFTPHCCIGQSSALCLEVPHRCNLPDIGKNFVFYKEDEGTFNLIIGLPYSSSLDLVPTVKPRFLELPYKTLFKINSLVQNGIIMGPTLDNEFYNLVNPHVYPSSYIEHALESFFRLTDSCLQPAKYLQEKYRIYKTLRHPPKPAALDLEPGLVYVYRVQVTPSKVYFCGPEVNVSNRVLRNYPEEINNFLRVSLVDEEFEKIRSVDLQLRTSVVGNKDHTDVYKRFLSILRNGIVVGDKKFEFLAFSSSQLRENSAWMFASHSGLTAAGIREWMGDFSQIRNVARYAARLGQSFSSSTETLSVRRHEYDVIDDEKTDKYTFSDGIGGISADFAEQVATKCNCKGKTPSAFQIRYGGYKGVVAVWPMPIKYKLLLRPSMSKYESDNTKLDVLGWTKYQPCFLNRQLITLLSTLGVKDHVFEIKQQEAVDQLNAVLKDPIKAQEALEVMSPGENTRILRELLMCGYMPDSEPFLSMMLRTFRASKLLELRTKSRIFIRNGRSMMGCLDETRTLNYGQVFVNISRIGCGQFYNGGMCGFSETYLGDGSLVLEGKVVVAKNPCLHPGDVRILTAVNVPDLHHMVDCVVFPQKGKRPHPNECSGSDLDGDIYFVSWDSELIPPRQIQPMEYDAAPSTALEHDVSIQEVEEYFVNYMVNDSLGVIANAHTVFADKEESKAESKACLELARLFSIAVDFPKTGKPAEIPPELQVRECPDFMEKPDKPNYESKRVIGKLYRAVKDISSDIKPFTLEVARECYDVEMEVDGFENFLEEAQFHKGEYDFKLSNLMEHYGIKTEAEILSGSVMKMSKSFTKYKDAEVIAHAVRSLRKEVKRWFYEMKVADDEYAKASAWYHVTYHPYYWGMYNQELNRPHFLSFAWVVYDKLVVIKKKKLRKPVGPSSLYRRMGNRLRLL